LLTALALGLVDRTPVVVIGTVDGKVSVRRLATGDMGEDRLVTLVSGGPGQARDTPGARIRTAKTLVNAARQGAPFH